MKNLLLILFVTVFWKFEFCVFDSLEFQDEIGGEWHQIPGPYHLSLDGTEYEVQVDSASPHRFYRVNRSWGMENLFLLEEPDRTADNTQQCQ